MNIAFGDLLTLLVSSYDVQASNWSWYIKDNISDFHANDPNSN